MHRIASFHLGLLISLGCGDGDSAGSNVAVDAGAAQATPEGGTSGPGGGGSCDLSGVWIARMNSESRALSLPQYANTWYLYEFAQRESALEVTRHLDCGIEVRGTVRVNISRETTSALLRRNSQVGRRGSVLSDADGSCSFALERFWSVRGVSEQRFAPSPRSASLSLAELQASAPLPTSGADAEDWDGDGKPGVQWLVGAPAMGTRHTAQRDWTRYFTAPGYAIPALGSWENLVVRAEFAAEEVLYEASSPTLAQLSQPNVIAEHTLTLRYLGRTRDDERARALLAPTDEETCTRIQQALPSVAGLK